MPESDLARLLQTMSPQLHERPYVFCTVESIGDLEDVLGFFREEEGLSIILEQESADRRGLAYTDRWACITLTVHSALTAVGFIAALSARLAEAGLSVNPVAAYYHDHLFVPWERRGQAMDVLAACRSHSSGI